MTPIQYGPPVPPPPRRANPMILPFIVLILLAVGLGIKLASDLAGPTPPAGPPAGPTMPTPTPSAPTEPPPPTQPTQSAPPGVAVSPAPVIEATDLPVQPETDHPWSITPDGAQHVESYVTPCGVLVSLAELDSGGLVVSGYDIASGRLLWSDDLFTLTGQVAPERGLENVTYSPGCVVLMDFWDDDAQTGSGRTVYVAFGLTDGAARVIDTEGLTSCMMAGDGWAGCAYMRNNGAEQYMMAVDLSTGNTTWTESAPGAWTYYNRGSLVVDGHIWTPEGYRDPATRDIAFGEDVTVTDRDRESNKTNVTYVQVFSPGGYLTDLTVRLEGQMGGSITLCNIQLWDTATGKAVWEAGRGVLCGRLLTYRWVTAGQVLLGESAGGAGGGAIGIQVSAFALADGRYLWDSVATLGASAWDPKYVLYPTGAAEAIVQLVRPDMTDEIRRVSDGAEMSMPATGSFAASETMVYFATCKNDAPPCVLTAYRPDPAKPATVPARVWQIPLVSSGPAPERIWTFVTGGKMYAVVQADRAVVIPLK